jgi:hypothetical protein
MDGDYEKTALLTTIPRKFLFGQPVALIEDVSAASGDIFDESKPNGIIAGEVERT